MPVWLSDHEYATLRAACAQMLPSGEGTPGAEEAGVVDYIDGFLGAFTFDPPRIWAGGPSSGRKGGVAGFATFHRLSPLDELAWRLRLEGSQGKPEREFNGPVMGLQELYRDGLAALGEDFTQVNGREQRRRLRHDEAFCELLWGHCCEGMYGAPEYGGNRDTVGWEYIDYEGDVQPRGYSDAEVSPAMSPSAIIIGSGPGGATAAEVLTRAGWDVVIMEKGRNHLLDPDDLTRPAGDYSNDEIKFISRYFLGPDPLVEPRAFRLSVDDGEHTHVGEVNSIPTTVGGGGTHADGKVPRFREEDFGLLSTYGPQEGAVVDDWPLEYDELEPYYAEVERAIGVSGREGANPFAAWRSGPYPMAPGAPMYGAVLSSAAAEKVGLHPYEAPTAANSIAYDGRPACNNCGFCAFFGCPIHAKGDPVALLTRAMATGRAELMAETYVSRIITQGRRATGVEFIDRNGVTHTREADTVIVAGGAIETPRLLLMSGLDHPALGRYLMVHFQTIVVGHFADMRLHPHKGRSVTHVHDDAMIQDDRTRQAAVGAGLPWFRGGLVEHSGGGLPIMEARHSPWGRLHAQTMRESNLRERMWAFIMQGEDLAYATNTVDLSPSIRDARGYPVARVTYQPGHHELAASKYHGKILQSVLEEMGAEWVIHTSSPGVSYHGIGASPIPESRHVMGTVRMGDNPDTAVVDRWGRVHSLDNVVVADSSVFVTSSGYGPTLTLVALAARAAHHLAGTAPEAPAAV